MMIRFGETWVFLFMILVPAMGAFMFLTASWRRAALKTFAEERFIDELTASFWRDGRTIRRAAALLALFFLILSMARPQFGTKQMEVFSHGINVMIAIDTSKSMLAEDFKPNRLLKARHQIGNFLDRVSGDRVGLLFFAGDAFVHCPLTLDYGTVKLFLEDMDTAVVDTPGTSLHKAILASVEAFPEKGRYNNVLILLTDGEDHSGKTVEAAKVAAAKGIKIYTIGIGSVEGALIPIRDARGGVEYLKDRKGEFVQSRLDVDTLRKVALETGGKFYHATPGEMELERIFEDIDSMEKEELSAKRYTVYEDRFQWSLFLALLFILTETLVPERRTTDGSSKRRRSLGAGLMSGEEGRGTADTAMLILFAFFVSIAMSLFTTGSALGLGIDQLNGEGNRLLAEGKPAEALEKYNEALTADPTDRRLVYNIGAANYQQKDFEKAVKEFTESSLAEDSVLRGKSFYNLGNSYFQMKDYLKAIEAYKECLKVDSGDTDAKYNIELARKMLKENAKNEQQDQQDQQKQDQQDQQKQSKGEKKQGEEEKDKGQAEQDQKQDQPNDQKEKQAEDQKEPDKAEKEQKEETAESQQRDLSKEEAERLLQSMMDDEKRERDQQTQRRPGSPRVDKDW